MKTCLLTKSVLSKIVLTLTLSVSWAYASASNGTSKNRLTEAQAMMRSQIVSNVRYELKLNLTEQETFSGEVRALFDVTRTSDNLFMDFDAGEILELVINTNTVDKPQLENGHFDLPKKFLKMGHNDVLVKFKAPYSKTGNGLYLFKDPEDKRSYVYSNFEPYSANNMLPCFDQPDLKAVFRLQIEVPKKWQVVSNTMEEKVTTTSTHKIWKFAPSPTMSTYLLAVMAGEYKVWNEMAGNIPLRLLVRQSLAKHVKPAEWFPITKAGLKHFGEYFDIPYPFKKYDQIIVPDFISGAMENIGAVTFSERFVARGPKTDDQKESLGNVILHEMAHMWFGDLVTMKWWNDLWLNESFATHMAVKAMVAISPFKRGFEDFFTYRKSGGYWEDSLVTTHPIEGLVPDTSQATANFDNITYAKGASTLKQLEFYVGPDKFRAGVRNYLKKYSYKNARREDFVGAVAEAAQMDLSRWTKTWLTQSGTDTVRWDVACTGGKISSFKMIATPPEGQSELRPHRLIVGLFQRSGQKVHMQDSVTVMINSAETQVPELVGKRCPLLVLANMEDHDFITTQLDSTTLTHLPGAIDQLAVPFHRSMFWYSLFQMVRAQKLSVQSYADTFIKSLRKENDRYVFTQLLVALENKSTSGISYYWPRETPGQLVARKEFNSQLEQIFWDRFTKAEPGSSRQLELYDAFVGSAQSQESLARLNKLLTGQLSVKGFKLDQDRRWRVIGRMVVFRFPEGSGLLEKEQKLDSSERGIQAALGIKAAQPDINIKNQMRDELEKSSGAHSLARMSAVAAGLYPSDVQDDLRLASADHFFEKLPEMIQQSPEAVVTKYARYLQPFACEENVEKQATKFLNRQTDLPAPVRKTLLIGRQESERCRKIRSFSATAPSAQRVL